jgi:hypothetical protein
MFVFLTDRLITIIIRGNVARLVQSLDSIAEHHITLRDFPPPELIVADAHCCDRVMSRADAHFVEIPANPLAWLGI